MYLFFLKLWFRNKLGLITVLLKLHFGIRLGFRDGPIRFFGTDHRSPKSDQPIPIDHRSDQVGQYYNNYYLLRLSIVAVNLINRMMQLSGVAQNNHVNKILNIMS